MKNFRIFNQLAFLLFFMTAGVLYASSFTSDDGVFTLDLPAGWKKVSTNGENFVLSLRKENSAMDIKSIACTTEQCLDEKINRDLAEVKAKKMTVVSNTYTGEEIKRIDFSTGEPLFYISFFTPKNDFSAGYFLMNDHAYSILAKNITYAEADLLFSFFAPLRQDDGTTIAAPPQEISLEMDENSPLAYDITALPDVKVEAIEPPITQEEPVVPQAEPVSSVPQTHSWKTILKKIKIKWNRSHFRTFIHPQMPPYLRALGHGFDVLVGMLVLFGFIWAFACLLRPFITPRPIEDAKKSTSFYPIRARRLYGTPSLIFRTKDNQGNVLISLSSRWNSICICFGLIILVLSISILAFTSAAQQGNLLNFSPLTYGTIYSICSLLLPIGGLFIVTGIIWGLLILREMTLFDRKGKKAAVVLQKGFPLFYEHYDIHFAQSREVLHVRRKRFSLRRCWQIMEKKKKVSTSFTERSLCKSILRRLLGHLWGFLRTDYLITGPEHSRGAINSTHALFNRLSCNVDNPEAIPAHHALIVTALINMRDRDKWYPWFN